MGGGNDTSAVQWTQQLLLSTLDIPLDGYLCCDIDAVHADGDALQAQYDSCIL